MRLTSEEYTAAAPDAFGNIEVVDGQISTRGSAWTGFQKAFRFPTTLASLDDIIRSKEAAGRDKDRLQLPMLRALQQRQRRLDKPPEST